MNALNNYRIDLKNMRPGVEEYQFALDDAFFNSIGATLIQKGHVDVALRVKNAAGAYEMTFSMKGTVKVPCDLCLEDMDQQIDAESVLRVKLGDEFEDEGDLVIIPYEDGSIDLSWYIYEFIALEIPMKHVHEPGKCNEAMLGALERHLSVEPDAEDGDEDEQSGEDRPVDPRWSELKKILDNN